MTWLKVDDGLHSHPKAYRAGTAALGLWVRCGSWSAQHLTEGFIPHDIVAAYGTPAMRKSLVSAGFWVTADGGFQMHDYLDRNPSRDEVQSQRDAAAERQKRARLKARESRRDGAVTTTVTHAVSHGPVTPVVTVPPTRPDPTRPKEQEQPRTSSSGDLAPLAAPGEIVAEFVDAATGAGMDRPGKTIVARVGKAAKGLLADNANPDDLLVAARRLGANGWDDLEREVRRVQSERNPAVTNGHRPSTTDIGVRQTLTIAARLREQETNDTR